MDAVSRFWRQVDVRGDDECWPWLGTKATNGYGRFWFNGRAVPAHRFSRELVSRVSDGLFVLHHCDNKPCVNPRHLFVGTISDNARDCSAKGRHNFIGRPTHCKRGHKFTPRNTITKKDGFRDCRTCKYARDKANLKRKRDIAAILKGEEQ